MAAVDAVHAEVLVAELHCLRIEPIELIDRQQQARPAGELGLQHTPQSVDGVQVVEIERCDGRAAAGPDDDEAFSLQASQRLANRDEAHIQHRGDLAERKFLSGRQHTRQNRPAQLFGDLGDDRTRRDRPYNGV